MSKAAASTSSHKSSFSAAALVTTKDTLTFRLHPKQLVAFRSKATEILYRGAAGGGKPHLMRPPPAGCNHLRGSPPAILVWLEAPLGPAHTSISNDSGLAPGH